MFTVSMAVGSKELAKRGVSREQAYEWVQRNAMRAWDEELDFRELVRELARGAVPAGRTLLVGTGAESTRAVMAALEAAGIDGARMQRISGFADRKPAVSDPAAERNNRIEIILLRRDR